MLSCLPFFSLKEEEKKLPNWSDKCNPAAATQLAVLKKKWLMSIKDRHTHTRLYQTIAALSNEFCVHKKRTIEEENNNMRAGEMFFRERKAITSNPKRSRNFNSNFDNNISFSSLVFFQRYWSRRSRAVYESAWSPVDNQRWVDKEENCNCKWYQSFGQSCCKYYLLHFAHTIWIYVERPITFPTSTV